MIENLDDLYLPNKNQILGEGALSKVHFTINSKDNKKYALKIVNINNIGEADLENLKREIRLHKNLFH